MVKYGPRMCKMVLKAKNGTQNVQYSLKWSSMVQHGPKWSKKTDNKFNKMALYGLK